MTLCACLLALLPTQAASAPAKFDPKWTEKWTETYSISTISDIKAEHPAYDALRSLTERYGVVQGLADGTWRPDAEITEGEFVSYLRRCFDQLGQLAQVIGDEEKDKLLANMLRGKKPVAFSALKGLDPKSVYLEDYRRLVDRYQAYVGPNAPKVAPFAAVPHGKSLDWFASLGLDVVAEKGQAPKDAKVAMSRGQFAILLNRWMDFAFGKLSGGSR